MSDRDAMHELLKTTHRKVVPYTSSNKRVDDVWSALIDLDGGLMAGKGKKREFVQLVYADRIMDAFPHGDPDTWNRGKYSMMA